MAINRNVLAEKQATVLSEDGNTMYATIQMRHGKESEMDKSKFVPAEMGVATDTRKVFIAFAPNNVEEMALKKDIPDGTMDYGDLENKPSIGGIELKGNKTLEQLGIQPKGNYLTKVPDGYVKGEDLQLSLAKKLDKNQGTENAGKTLVVGKDGNVIHGGNLESLAIKLTASGDSPLSIRDSSEWKVQNFAMQGKTEQMQTTGAQLIEYPYLNDSQTINGVTFSVLNQGEIRVQGEATQTVNFPLYSFNYKNGKSYYISGCPKGGSSGTYNIRTGNGRAIDTGDGITYSPNEDGSTNININIQTGTKVNGLIFKPMLNSGSEALPWEPYTGGQPSPSPDYPQEIVNGGNYNDENQKWEYEVSIKGKNLAKVVNFSGATIAGVKVTVDKNGRYKLSGVATGETVYLLNQPHGSDFGNFPIIFTLKPGHKYRIMDTQLFVRRNDGTTATIGITKPSDLGGNGIIYEPIQDMNVIGIRIYIKNGATYNDSTLYTPGAWEDPDGTDTIWEPYRTPQTLVLQSDRPLTKWDRLEKRDGQWGWMFKSGKTELDGSEDENWSYYSEGRYWTNMQYKKLSEVGGEKSLICDKLRVLPTSSSTQDMENNTIKESGTLGITSVFTCAEETGNDVTSLRAWLQSNPLTIWYETAEETFVPLTESEQTALEALTTYFPTTIISNDADCEMEIEYVADTKTYIDNKFAELAQNLAAMQNTLLEV